ncbi:FliH/SctL family protein [Humitalea rosea]|uniref:hypothetical protein n=1 Tax=Humitalea rosea TaxID=990373 RepID=UPI0013143397|nr:hypothetical protein [Humitalea rosea]
MTRITATLRTGLLLPDLDAPPPPPPPEDTSAQDLDALLDEARATAREIGFSAGRAAGLAEARGEDAAQAARSLAALAQGLEAAATAAVARAEEDAAALAGLLLAALDAALPYAAAHDGAAQAARAATRMAATLTAGRQPRCLVATALVATVTDLLGEHGPPVQGDPALAPGDARLVWEDGGVETRLADRRRAIHEILAAFGLADDKEQSA